MIYSMLFVVWEKMPMNNHESFLIQECLNKWDQIPDDTDILISHTPPVGYGDLCCTGVRAGCVELLNTVRLRVRPKVASINYVISQIKGCLELK